MDDANRARTTPPQHAQDLELRVRGAGRRGSRHGSLRHESVLGSSRTIYEAVRSRADITPAVPARVPSSDARHTSGRRERDAPGRGARATEGSGVFPVGLLEILLAVPLDQFEEVR